MQDFIDNIGYKLNYSALLLNRVLDKEVNKVSSLSGLHFMLLYALKNNEYMTILEVQAKFGITDIELDSFLSPLISQALINRVSSENLIITEIGSVTINNLWYIVEKAELKISAALSEKEKQDLDDLLNKIQNVCSKLLS